MKKTKIIKGLVFAGMTLSMSAAVLLTPTTLFNQEPTVVEAAQTADVANLDQFKAALLNVNVTEINVTQSFSFKGDIHKVPNRDLVINGNADKGIVITSGKNSIYGNQNKSNNNLLSIKNATIAGDATVGRFFTGGAGNGPSSFGWDVYAEGVTYTGARFVHLSEGKLTFGGTNNINTRAENAWVHSLEFLPNSVYNGIAANKDHSQFSAFYFNGRLVNGKAVGTVKIGKEALVNVKIGPQSNKNYYYPVFYDKVYKVDIDESATLDVDAAGVAFQFIPRADYLVEKRTCGPKGFPMLNLAKNSKAYFNGRGGGNYATMKLQYYGTQVNVDEGAELVVTGKSTHAVIESIYKGTTFNLRAPGNFEIANKEPNKRIFKAIDTTINATDISEISYWNQLGGDYNVSPTGVFAANELFNVNFGKCDSKTLSVNATDPTTKANFKMENYGKLSLKGKATTTPEPEPEPIWNDYRVAIESASIVIEYLQADRLELYVDGDLVKIMNVAFENTLASISIDFPGINTRDVIEVKGFYKGEEVGYGRLN